MGSNFSREEHVYANSVTVAEPPYIWRHYRPPNANHRGTVEKPMSYRVGFCNPQFCPNSHVIPAYRLYFINFDGEQFRKQFPNALLEFYNLYQGGIAVMGNGSGIEFADKDAAAMFRLRFGSFFSGKVRTAAYAGAEYPDHIQFDDWDYYYVENQRGLSFR